MLEKKLLNDEKQCAEHVMLVDLGRNDVGRVCVLFFYAFLIFPILYIDIIYFRD